MNTMDERVRLLQTFEHWARPQGLDLATKDGGFTYTHPRTADAWRGFYAAHITLGLSTECQQLYAEFKRSSPYLRQIERCRNSRHGYPFKVRITADPRGLVVKGGLSGHYRLSEVNLYVIEKGVKIRLH